MAPSIENIHNHRLQPRRQLVDTAIDHERRAVVLEPEAPEPKVRQRRHATAPHPATVLLGSAGREGGSGSEAWVGKASTAEHQIMINQDLVLTPVHKFMILLLHETQ